MGRLAERWEPTARTEWRSIGPVATRPAREWLHLMNAAPGSPR